ncbi:hypothetical protein C8J57DRAFT_1729222 [Mycena rebaudengoi]|nr:hypothetical protein C8J57DRAFT_1729222 [Mycena rebaudengoi]
MSTRRPPPDSSSLSLEPSSFKLQASSFKLQASIFKLQSLKTYNSSSICVKPVPHHRSSPPRNCCVRKLSNLPSPQRSKPSFGSSPVFLLHCRIHAAGPSPALRAVQDDDGASFKTSQLDFFYSCSRLIPPALPLLQAQSLHCCRQGFDAPLSLRQAESSRCPSTQGALKLSPSLTDPFNGQHFTPQMLKSDADDAASAHSLSLNHHHPSRPPAPRLRRLPRLRHSPSAPNPPVPCSPLPVPRPSALSSRPIMSSPPSFPYSSSSSISLGFLFSCHPFHVPVAPVSISSRNRRRHEDNLDTLGSLVLCYMHTTSLSLPLTLSLSLSPLSALSTLLPPPTRLPTYPTPTSRDGSDNADSVDEASAAQHAASA